MIFWLIILFAVVAGLLLPSMGSSVHAPENPNANNPDAFEADLDPEGDEPEGY